MGVQSSLDVCYWGWWVSVGAAQVHRATRAQLVVVMDVCQGPGRMQSCLNLCYCVWWASGGTAQVCLGTAGCCGWGPRGSAWVTGVARIFA